MQTNTTAAAHTSNLINGFYWIKQLRIMAAAAATLGSAPDAMKWGALADSAAASYERLYFSTLHGRFADIECRDAAGAAGAAESGGLKQPCHSNHSNGVMSVQTAQALPLFLGLPLAAEGKQRAGDALAADVLHGVYPGRTDTGLVGTKYVLSALVATGHADVAMQVATAMEYPSWGRMLPQSVHPKGQGEGTLWEQFGGDQHHGFGSRNHMYGACMGGWCFCPMLLLHLTPAGCTRTGDPKPFLWATVRVRVSIGVIG
jgi:hypothetical protein